jgi:hypothetical protein
LIRIGVIAAAAAARRKTELVGFRKNGLTVGYKATDRGTVLIGVRPMVRSPGHLNGLPTPVVLAVLFLASAPSVEASEEFTQRFDPGRVNTRILRFIGPAKSGAITETDQGLLIRLPDKTQGATQAGIATRFGIQGDFEITVRYELVDVPTPEKGFGTGVVIHLARPEKSQTLAGLGRRKRQDGSEMFNANVLVNVDGQPKSNQTFLEARAECGGLRLVRKGTMLRFLVADGNDEDFRELRQVEFDTEPVKSVLVLGDTGNSDAATSIRIKSFSIQAGTLPTGITERRRSVFGLTTAVIGIIAVAVLAGCSIWYWRRK